MSKIRQELEFYRLGDTIETEIGDDNVSDIYTNTYATSGQLKTVTAGTSATDATTMEQFTGTPAMSGYQMFPNGMVMQWGHAVIDLPAGLDYSNVDVTLPYNGMTDIYNVQVTSNSGPELVSVDSDKYYAITKAYLLSPQQIKIYIKHPGILENVGPGVIGVFWNVIGSI